MKKIIIIVLLCIIIFVSFCVVDGYIEYRKAISEASLENKYNQIKNSQDYTPISSVPTYYLNAIVAVEDHRFYEHNGFDIISIARAFVENFKQQSLTQGGSSITQQVAKNLYFSQEKKFTRKIAELFVAIDLEKKYSKSQILEMYINNIYFGDGYYNVHDACLGYFNKLPSELTLDEATLLAGIPNAPSVYSPTKNPDLAKLRQKHVLDRMLKYNYISVDEYNNVIN